MTTDSYEIYGKKALDVAYRTALSRKHHDLLANILAQAQQGINPIDLPKLTDDELHCLHVHYIYPENNKIYLVQRAVKDPKVSLATEKPKLKVQEVLVDTFPWDE